MTTSRRTATGTFTVALPPNEAFHLFTPRGEQLWAAGWNPQFPADAPDDTAPGTVFTTNASGRLTTWLVIDSTRGHTISYARLLPHVSAGTVRVTLRPSSQTPGPTEVTVTYDLTVLSPEAEPTLHHFFEGYEPYLESWRQAIANYLAKPTP